MLIIASISGIQDYLFQVRETGGKQAKTLRFRSLYVQLVIEAVGIGLLNALNLDKSRLIFCAAGKLAIDGRGVTSTQTASAIEQARQIETWLREKTHAQLRLSTVIEQGAGQSISQLYNAAARNLQKKKLQAWSTSAVAQGQWQPALLAAPLLDIEQEADENAALGQKIVAQNSRYIVLSQPDKTGPQGAEDIFDVAGLSARFTTKKPDAPSPGSAVRDLGTLARHVPTDSAGHPVDFAELAAQSSGAPMLGVLKADADSLGQAVSRCLENAGDLALLKNLSSRLETFFSQQLDDQLKHHKAWSNIYTVFSGGDDVLLVGPWNDILDFAGKLHEQFIKAFKADGLTISAGVAIVKPRYPIRLGAQQSEALLEKAKTGNKNQCAVFDTTFNWTEHQKMIDGGKQLARWADDGVIQRGWLNTLLELTLTRRGEKAHSEADVPKAAQLMATAHLSYQIARNWPKANDKHPQKRAARAWIDGICDTFDNTGANNYLPAILRYAILATKSKGSE